MPSLLFKGAYIPAKEDLALSKPAGPDDFDSFTLEAEPSPSASGSRIIGRVLPPAVRLLIQTQVDQVENLQFRLDGRDRQLVSGYVPRVLLSADRAVYQGLYLSHVQAQAEEIRVNLGQVLRGKPLRLLQRFPIRGQVVLLQQDLAASLQAPLLRQGLVDFLRQLVLAQGPEVNLAALDWLVAPAPAPAFEPAFEVEAVAIAPEQLSLTLRSATAAAPALTLQTGLVVEQGRLLVLQQPLLSGLSPEPLPLQGFTLDLGSEVQIERFDLAAGRIEISGVVQVVPAD